jgi:hypothetical protein
MPHAPRCTRRAILESIMKLLALGLSIIAITLHAEPAHA